MTVHGNALKAMFPAWVRAYVNDPPQEPEALETSAFPYVVIWLPEGLRSTERLAAEPHRADFYFSTICVGLDVAGLDAIRSAVVDSFALQRPSVAGRVCDLLEHTSSLAPQRDTDIPGRVIFNAADSWHFVSTAA